MHFIERKLATKPVFKHTSGDVPTCRSPSVFALNDSSVEWFVYWKKGQSAIDAFTFHSTSFTTEMTVVWFNTLDIRPAWCITHHTMNRKSIVNTTEQNTITLQLHNLWHEIYVCTVPASRMSRWGHVWPVLLSGPAVWLSGLPALLFIV